MIDYYSMTKETLVGLLEDTLEYAEKQDAEVERLSINYEQALEDLDKKENIIKEVREYFKNHTLKYDDLMLIKPSDVLEILDKESQ